MTESEKAIQFVLKNEGGFVDNANDSGGATNFGISLRFLRGIPVDRLRRYGFFALPENLSVADIQEITVKQAENIYQGEFWDQARFEEIHDQYLCNYVFDSCVLHGLTQGIKFLQRSFWAIHENNHFIKDDGILGDQTISVLDHSIATDVLIAMRAERAGFMRLIAHKNSKDREFLDGWLNRCYQR